jgi:hypothetical protein
MLEIHFNEKGWRAKALRAISENQRWQLVAAGRSARKLGRRLPRLLSKEKLGFLDFAWMFSLGAFPAVFFYANGKGFEVREARSDDSTKLVVEFTPPGTQAAE